MRVLVVDDHAPDNRLVREAVGAITDPEIELFKAATITEALAILEASDIDLCVVDYFLAESNTAGDLLKAARQRGHRIPFISITGRADEDALAHELLAMGFDDVVHKDDVQSANFYRIIRNAWLRNQHDHDMEELADTDELTGRMNRRSLLKRMELECDRSARAKVPFAVLFMDLNDFKKLNDKYGHAAGDKALVHFAELVNGLTRATDAVARLGGDEFVILMPGSTEQMGQLLKNKVMNALAAAPLVIDGAKVELSASIGVVTYASTADLVTPKALLKAADESMYAGKKSGSKNLKTPS